MMGLTFFSVLDWGSYSISIAKTDSKKIQALIRSVKVALYLCKSTIQLFMDYCCLVCVGVPSCCLE